MGLFESSGLPGLARLMSLGAWRQRACASNVANADTPGYRRVDVRFADELQRTQGGLELAGTDPSHFGATNAAPLGIEVYDDAASNPGGGVDLEREMVALAEAQMSFDLAARLAGLRIAGIRAAIHGRR